MILLLICIVGYLLLIKEYGIRRVLRGTGRILGAILFFVWRCIVFISKILFLVFCIYEFNESRHNRRRDRRNRRY